MIQDHQEVKTSCFTGHALLVPRGGGPSLRAVTLFQTDSTAWFQGKALEDGLQEKLPPTPPPQSACLAVLPDKDVFFSAQKSSKKKKNSEKLISNQLF